MSQLERGDIGSYENDFGEGTGGIADDFVATLFKNGTLFMTLFEENGSDGHYGGCHIALRPDETQRLKELLNRQEGLEGCD